MKGRMVVASGCGVGRAGETLVKRVQCQCQKKKKKGYNFQPEDELSYGDLCIHIYVCIMYSTVTIVSNTISCT